MGIKPASSLSQTADFSTIVVVAVDRHQNRYIVEYMRKRMTPMKLAEEILTYFQRYHPQKTRIESVGYQEMLREYLRTREFIPGMEIKHNPRAPKSRRLETMEPFFAQGKVFLKPEMKELVDELLLYPRGKHDDLLDGLYYAMKHVYEPHHEEERLARGPRGEILTDRIPEDDSLSQDWMLA